MFHLWVKSKVHLGYPATSLDLGFVRRDLAPKSGSNVVSGDYRGLIGARISFPFEADRFFMALPLFIDGRAEKGEEGAKTAPNCTDAEVVEGFFHLAAAVAKPERPIQVRRRHYEGRPQDRAAEKTDQRGDIRTHLRL